MVRDEAPAATIGGVNGIRESDRAEIGSATSAGFNSQESGPTSLVAAEIHLGLKASRHLRRLAALQHSSYVPCRRA
jgi:hypothetical protein